MAADWAESTPATDTLPACAEATKNSMPPTSSAPPRKAHFSANRLPTPARATSSTGAVITIRPRTRVTSEGKNGPTSSAATAAE